MKKVLFFLLVFISSVFADMKEGRNFTDLPDVDDGYNIHVIYALPSDGIDKEYDLTNQISMLVYQMDKWFNKKTKNRLFQDGQNLKFDRKEDGRIDISFLRMEIDNVSISKKGINAVNVIQAEISRLGFNDEKKVYFVVYGGSNKDVCASSQLPQHAPKSIVANTAALYYPGKGDDSCVENNGGFKPEFNNTTRAALHEVFHVLGAVPKCAPEHLVFGSEGTINDGIGGHLSIPGDIMFSVQSNVTFSKMDNLDMTSNNYYNHNNDCLDLAKSRYVTPTVEDPQLPTYGIE